MCRTKTATAKLNELHNEVPEPQKVQGLFSAYQRILILNVFLSEVQAVGIVVHQRASFSVCDTQGLSKSKMCSLTAAAEIRTENKVLRLLMDRLFQNGFESGCVTVGDAGNIEEDVR